MPCGVGTEPMHVCWCACNLLQVTRSLYWRHCKCCVILAIPFALMNNNKGKWLDTVRCRYKHKPNNAVQAGDLERDHGSVKTELQRGVPTHHVFASSAEYAEDRTFKVCTCRNVMGFKFS